MLAYAIYNRNRREAPDWERHWYFDAGVGSLGMGMPASIMAQPSEDTAAHLSRAFILSDRADDQKKSADDSDLNRLNQLLSSETPDAAAVAEMKTLRKLLADRYPAPAIENGQKVYAAQDDAYYQHALRAQYGDGTRPGVRHHIPRIKLGAIFANAAAAKDYSTAGGNEYAVTEPAPPPQAAAPEPPPAPVVAAVPAKRGFAYTLKKLWMG